jgi:hypothetical protein
MLKAFRCAAVNKGFPFANARKAIDAVLENIENLLSNDVFGITGPASLNRALATLDVNCVPHSVTCYQRTFTNELFH